MKKWCLVLGLMMTFAACLGAAEEYPLTADSERQPGVPQGKVTQYAWDHSKIFPGTTRDYYVYVPAQYTPDKPACVMLFEDGKSYVVETGRARIPIVFDNLIAKHEMPVTIAILINPGGIKATAGGDDRVNRSYEYDSLSDRYARFLLDEILPEVAKHYNLSTNPDDRAICGGSSGGICSFNVAWMHPEAFHRVLSFIGSFADIRGGDIYPFWIRKTEPKPIRVFMQDGDHDLKTPFGDWWLANQTLAAAFAYMGYDYKFATGDKDHDMIQGGAIMPDALRWLWRGYPQPITAPALHPLGEKASGFVDVAPEWEKVGDSRNLPPASLGSTFVFTPGGIPSRLRLGSGIAVNQQGDVFISDASRTISKIDASGRLSKFIANADVPMGLAMGPDGLLYACEKTDIASYDSNGKKSVRTKASGCLDLVVLRKGGIYFTELNWGGLVGYIPPGETEVHHPLYRVPGVATEVPNGITLSPGQSFVYTSQLGDKWVWSYQFQPDGSLANGEPFFRLETPDESSASGAAGMAMDRQGLLYVATLLGVQVCSQQGAVTAILNRPQQADPLLGPISGVALGGPDQQYLYIVIGNEVYRRHLARRSE